MFSIVHMVTGARFAVPQDKDKRTMRHENNIERLAVSVEDAAAMAGIGRTTLYDAMGSGSLRSLKIGKRRLIRLDALREWIAAHESDEGRAA
jgi:excisionase family DNA binding protein